MEGLGDGPRKLDVRRVEQVEQLVRQNVGEVRPEEVQREEERLSRS